MSDSFSVVDVEHDGHVATVWLNRPEKRNALGPAFWKELPLAMADVSEDPGVRCVVLAARGPHFSVGLDLSAIGDLMQSGPNGAGGGAPGGAGAAATSPAAVASVSYREIRRLQDSVSSLERCPKPVVAAIQGYCIGGGVDLITACDVRVASADAVFSVRETRMAMVADLGSLQRLPRIVGAGHTAELAYTGADIDAARAEAIGLVNRVTPNAEAALDAAREIAGRIAANSPLAVQGTKAVLAACADRSVEEGLQLVATWNAAFLRSDDLAEAVGAFFAKRDPSFRGH